MRERTNIMLDVDLKNILRQIATKSQVSISELINQRLSSSIHDDDIFGVPPKHLTPISAWDTSWEIPYPEELNEYYNQLDKLNLTINNLLLLKKYFLEQISETSKKI